MKRRLKTACLPELFERFRQSSSENEDGDSSQNQPNNRTPYIPISVVTGSRDIASVSADLRAYLQSGSSPLTNAIPKEHADLSNLVEKVGESIDFKDWADKTTRQQQAIVQKSGLSGQDQMSLLNAASYYVETIAKVRDLFAHRDAYGLTLTDATKLAKELFNIADERDEATRRVGKYANDTVFAPKVLRWLDEQEDNLLAGIGMSTNDAGRSAWYNGKNSATAAKQTAETKNADSGDYIQVPKQTAFGPKSNNPAVNCYGYVLMYLGIQPDDGNYDIQPGQLSDNGDKNDHALNEMFGEQANYDIASVSAYMVRDFEQAGKTVRKIDSYQDAIMGESVIALKTLNPLFGMRDYHFAILLPDGTWADKQGTKNDSRQGAIQNPDESWGNWLQRYNSETYYFAVSQPSVQ